MSDHIQTERKRRDKGFLVADNQVARDNRLDCRARALFFYVLSMSEGWKFYSEKIRNDMGKMQSDGSIKPLGRDVYRGLIKELKAYGYLEVIDLRNDKGHFVGTKWVLDDTPDIQDVEAEGLKTSPPVTGCLKNRPSENTASRKIRALKKEQLNKKEQREEIKTKQKDLVSEFEGIWVHYRKLKDAGKKDALAAYKVARRKVSFDEITQPLGEYMRHRQGQNPKYTVHLSRWLQKERWRDNQVHAANANHTSDDQLDGLMGQTSDAQLENLFPERKALICP